MKKKNKGWIIAGSVILVLVLIIVLIPKILFTDYEGLPTSGAYGVKTVSAITIDESRLESFETDGSNRCLKTPLLGGKNGFFGPC